MRLRQWLWLVGLCLSCEDRPLVLVSVAPLPADAARLLVSLTYRSQPASAPVPINFDLDGQDLTTPATFGVRLPARTDGDLVVGAGVFDRDGCLSAFGSGATAAISQAPQIDVTLQHAPLDALTPAQRCEHPESTPLLLSVSPSLASSRGGDRVTVRGWGFTPAAVCPLVSINGETAPDVLCASLVELSATVPPSHGALGPAAVQVLNRNGRRAVDTALFSYYAENIRLGAAVAYAVGTSPSALAAGLIDGDLRPDLVVANRDGGTVTVLLNSGQGDFPTSSGFTATIPVGVSPSAVGIGDLDGDGVADIVAANASDHTVSALIQKRPAAPVAFLPARQIFVNLRPSALALADLNGDGALDAAVANQLSNDVSVLLNDRMGHLSKLAQHDYPVPREPTAVVVTDLDHDGAPDLVIGSAQAAELTLLHNRGGDYPQSLRSSITLEAPLTALAAADLDGDAVPEVIVALSNGTVAVLWNDGTGRLSYRAESPVTVAQGVTALGVGDLDLDGSPDVVASSAVEQRLYVLRNTKTRTGRRGLARLTGGYAVGSQPVAISVADFDGDKRPDVAVANKGSGSVTVLLNQSN